MNIEKNRSVEKSFSLKKIYGHNQNQASNNKSRQMQNSTMYSSKDMGYNRSNPRNKKIKFYKRKKFWVISSIISFLLLTLFYINPLTLQLQRMGLIDNPFDINKLAFSSLKSQFSKETNSLGDLNKTDDRTNVVLLGVDNRSDGKTYLTDSIILLSYHHNENLASMLSFPRDLYAEYSIDSNYYVSKINSVFPNAYKASNKTNEEDKLYDGYRTLSNHLEDISGLAVHYGMVFDFNSFEGIIDSIGGIEVEVENSFTDYNFPNDDDTGVITVSFEQGKTFMDGETALQYARSRKSLDNNEGSDFARAKRQQNVIDSVVSQIQTSNLFTKIDSVLNILDALEGNLFLFDFGATEIQKGIESRQTLEQIKINSLVLDFYFGSQLNSLLLDQTINEIFYLAPNNPSKSYDDVAEHLNFLLDNSFLLSEEPNVKIFNYSNISPENYFDFKNVLLDKNLKFEFSDFSVSNTILDITEAYNSSNQPTTTTIEQETCEVYLFLNPESQEDNLKSIEYYKNLVMQNEFTICEQKWENMNEDLMLNSSEQGIVIVFKDI